jgi:hypothetical protein
MSAEFIFYIVSLVFLAGGAWVTVKQMRRDLNAIGGKLGREMAKANTRHQNLSLAAMLMCDEEQREKIAELLRVESKENGS